MHATRTTRRWRLSFLFVAALLVVLALSAGIAQAAPAAGAVYTLSNAPTNQVLVFNRAWDGTLSPAGAFATGGMGGALGGPQGAIALSADNRWLFAVNAGSNDVTVFAVKPWGLVWVDKEPSGGTTPVSLTVHGDLLYVLNAGGAGNIAGFVQSRSGKLHAIPGSMRPLSGSGTGPSEVAFNPAGNVLVVTERNTNLIDVYKVDWSGRASAPTTHASNGAVPYGFAFSPRGTLVISEAAVNALSSYAVNPWKFQLISGSVSNGNTGNAPCWVAITENGKYAYTSDAHSGIISSYTIGKDGKLTLLAATAAGPVGVPLLDLAFSTDSRFLYGLDIGNGSIDAFRVNWDGSLTAIAGASGVPSSASGLAAR